MDASMLWTFIGVGLGVIGIAVTVWLSRPAKPKVKLEVANAWAAYDEHLGEWCASVEAINTGGVAVTLSGFGYRFPNGANLVPIAQEPGSTPLPHRLEPHTSATFLMQAEGILQECAARGVTPSQLKSWVRLQTGKTIDGAAPPIKAS